MSWLFLSHVNLHATSHVNISFHGKFWHSARKKLRGAMRGTSRVCEVVVEQYRSCENTPVLCKLFYVIQVAKRIFNR